MPRTYVNNNIKLKSGGGILNTSADGLEFDTTKVLGNTNLGLTATASDNLKQSADTERADSGRDPASGRLTKSIRISKSGVVRLKVDTKYTVDSTYSYIDFRVNGVSVSKQSSTSLTYVTKTYDVSVSIGDLVQVYTENYLQGGREVYVKNFRVYYDVTALTDLVITD